MSDTVDIILESLDGSDLWIFCHPLSEHPPQDLPEVRTLSEEYWSARLFTPNAAGTRWIGDWFSIPITNIQRVLTEYPEGAVKLNVSTLPDDQRTILFENTRIVFTIGYHTTEEEWLWLSEEDLVNRNQGDSES